MAVKDGRNLCKFEMPVAGLISKHPFEQTLEEYSEVDSKIAEQGCKFKNPHLIPVFLPFLALPEIRILYSGIVDVKNRTFLKILNQ